MNLVKRVALFAINNSEKEQHVEAYMRAHSIGFKKVKGSYKGNMEDSYVAIVDDDVKLDTIFSIAARFSQESILVVDELRQASFHDVLTGDVKTVGSFTAVTALEAQGLDGWTLDGTQYYAIL